MLSQDKRLAELEAENQAMKDLLEQERLRNLSLIFEIRRTMNAKREGKHEQTTKEEEADES